VKITTHMPTLCKLIGDRDEVVREASKGALVEIYRHVGERVRRDVSKAEGVPAARLQDLMGLFDAVLNSGTVCRLAHPRFSVPASCPFGRSADTPGGDWLCACGPLLGSRPRILATI